MDGWTDKQMDRRTDGQMYGNSPLCPTGNRPFGAAAQKAREQKSKKARNWETEKLRDWHWERFNWRQQTWLFLLIAFSAVTPFYELHLSLEEVSQVSEQAKEQWAGQSQSLLGKWEVSGASEQTYGTTKWPTENALTSAKQKQKRNKCSFWL